MFQPQATPSTSYAYTTTIPNNNPHGDYNFQASTSNVESNSGGSITFDEPIFNTFSSFGNLNQHLNLPQRYNNTIHTQPVADNLDAQEALARDYPPDLKVEPHFLTLTWAQRTHCVIGTLGWAQEEQSCCHGGICKGWCGLRCQNCGMLAPVYSNRYWFSAQRNCLGFTATTDVYLAMTTVDGEVCVLIHLFTAHFLPDLAADIFGILGLVYDVARYWLL